MTTLRHEIETSATEADAWAIKLALEASPDKAAQGRTK